jgi:hypothetical protein
VVEVSKGRAAMVVFIGEDALDGALVRSGRVVVHLVFTQDGTQMVWVPKTRVTWADALRSAVPGPVPGEPVPDPPGVR